MHGFSAKNIGKNRLTVSTLGRDDRATSLMRSVAEPGSRGGGLQQGESIRQDLCEEVEGSE